LPPFRFKTSQFIDEGDMKINLEYSNSIK